ncbi:hypothetical protein CLF_104372 [Clonorchis sinensis]|uniref:Uncharacterized protein n=1 Tax=Clonorchis sinensis TaxID=79923 RepID=G7YBI8_CLOSI|nr:hypothetical protein CLF_104372 [Clonorchis sinensis]
MKREEEASKATGNYQGTLRHCAKTSTAEFQGGHIVEVCATTSNAQRSTSPSQTIGERNCDSHKYVRALEQDKSKQVEILSGLLSGQRKIAHRFRIQSRLLNEQDY